MDTENIVICKGSSLPTYVLCHLFLRTPLLQGQEHEISNNTSFAVGSVQYGVSFSSYAACCSSYTQVWFEHPHQMNHKCLWCFLLFLHNLPHSPSSDELWTRHWVISGTNKNNERNSRENCECCIWELRELGGPVSLQISVIRCLVCSYRYLRLIYLV